MTLRQPFRPLRPDLDKFLFAAVGDEVDGIPLSVVSALTRLGLDPLAEAVRLSSLRAPDKTRSSESQAADSLGTERVLIGALSHREAVEQLARLIAELPGSSRTFGEAREIAGSLVNLLPKHDASPKSTPQIQIRPRFFRPRLRQLSLIWVICFVLAAATLISALAHGSFPFSIGGL